MRVVVAGRFLTYFEAVGLNQIEERPPSDYASASHRNLSQMLRYWQSWPAKPINYFTY